jgi:hypothetical protein
LNAYLAAVAEALAEECKLDPPVWIEDPTTFMDDWVYGHNICHPILRRLLVEQSPRAFQRRLIAVSENVLTRI